MGGVASANWIPIFYAVAMPVDALAVIVFNHWFDCIGLSVLIAAALLSALFWYFSAVQASLAPLA
jgi:hypothetical protein